MSEDHSKDTGVHDCTHVTVPEHSTQLERKTKEKQNKRKTPEEFLLFSLGEQIKIKGCLMAESKTSNPDS